MFRTGRNLSSSIVVKVGCWVRYAGIQPLRGVSAKTSAASETFNSMRQERLFENKHACTPSPMNDKVQAGSSLPLQIS